MKVLRIYANKKSAMFIYCFVCHVTLSKLRQNRETSDLLQLAQLVFYGRVGSTGPNSDWLLMYVRDINVNSVDKQAK